LRHLLKLNNKHNVSKLKLDRKYSD
jgi:hypothetical protein